MASNQQIAQDVLAAVGGAANVTSATHCMTRLRLNLKDQSIPNDDAIKKIPGVLGAQWSGGQYQVIIGQNVPKVYAEAVKLGITGEGAIDENLDGAKEPLTPRRVAENVLNYLSKSMVALIPIMMAPAMFRTVAVICGPDMLGLWAADSEIYNLFYNWIYNAGYYFMPITLGWSAARQLGASPQLGMLMGGILIAPELIAYVSAAAETGATTTMIYGFLPAALNNYSATVLPILLCMPVLWQVEKLMKKIVPDMLSTVFVPFCTLFVMIPVGLCVLAPIGSVLGDALGYAMFALGNSGGVVTVLVLTLVAALWEFLVMTGMHQVVLGLGIMQLLTAGSDSCIMVAGGIAQFATWGMAFGAFLRLKEKGEKGACLGYALSGILGGVTEPALYGCGFKYLRSLAGMVLGGAIGGIIAGVFGVTTYVLGATNVLGIIGFAAGGTMNLAMGVIASVAAFVAAAAITFLFGFTAEQLEEDAAAAAK